MLRRLSTKLLLPLIYLAMGWQFLEYYSTVPRFYLNLTEYLNGQERLPFQYRVLPVLFMKPLRSFALHSGRFKRPDILIVFALAAVALGFVYWFTLRLYRAASKSRRLEFLVFPLLIFILLWTYCVHTRAQFSYPYDLPSLAFFTAGIYFIYQRRFLPLLVTILIGTINRETTLFLIGVYLLESTLPLEDPHPPVDMLAEPASDRQGGLIGWLKREFSFKQIPWLQTALLIVTWAIVKAVLAYTFRLNDHAEFRTRIVDNLQSVAQPSNWPEELNFNGYLLPVVLLFYRFIPDRRLARYLLILVPWIAVMFAMGIVVETRIYGELSCLTGVCALLLLERYTEATGGLTTTSSDCT